LYEWVRLRQREQGFSWRPGNPVAQPMNISKFSFRARIKHYPAAWQKNDAAYPFFIFTKKKTTSWGPTPPQI
jgi:hypothetical protein